MEKFERKANEEGKARREKKKPSAKTNKIKVVPIYCKGCGLCVDVCPTGTLQLEDNIESKFGVSVTVEAPEYCIGCKLCEQRCPDFAIFVNYETEEKEEKKV